MSKRENFTWTLLACLMCLIPMIFPNQQVADWGSDWAFYLHQARNIVNGIPQLDNGYIVNEACFEISSQAYPIGFPLILSGVYLLFGENIPAFITLQTFILFLLGMTWFLTFRKKMGNLVAIIGVFFIVYSPYVIWYRNNILSEFSFLLFQSVFLLIYIFYDRRKYWWVLGLLYGLAWSVKGGGVQLIAGVFLFELFTVLMLSKSRLFIKLLILKIRLILGIFIIGMILNLLLNKILFNTGDNFSFYMKIYSEKLNLDLILPNLKYYLNEINYSFFIYWQMEWIGFLASILFLYFFINGFKVLVGREKVIVFILIIHLISIIAFPFQQGMRYALPMMPLIVYIMLKGGKYYFPNSSFLRISSLIIICCFIYSQTNAIKRYNAQVANSVTWTPYSYSTALAWQYIKLNTPPDAIFVTAFPRVLSFFTERPAFSPCMLDSEGIKRDIEKMKASYVVVNKQTERWAPTLEPFTNSKVSVLDTVYSNNEVVIFKIR